MSTQNIVIRVLRNQILRGRSSNEDDDEVTNVLERLINLVEVPSESDLPVLNETEFLRRIQTFMPHRDIETIREVVNRVGSNSRVFQDSLIRHYERRRNSESRERYYREDDIAESFDELLKDDEKDKILIVKNKKVNIINNDYQDYRTYPLKIDWDRINDHQYKDYEVMESYGNLGCFIYNNIMGNDMKISYLKLEVEILTMFLSEEKRKILIKSFPSLEQIENLIDQKRLQEKEMLIFKICMDVLEIFFSNVNYSERPIKLKFLSVASKYCRFLKTSCLSSSKTIESVQKALKIKIKSKVTLLQAYTELAEKYKINFLCSINSYYRRIKLEEEECFKEELFNTNYL